ncbi:MAG: hypothetical protein K8H88_30235, partial [Sandaracinaceae bacterium]|nr:hypothetical protein [Sandaracinaceae bacterium]
MTRILLLTMMAALAGCSGSHTNGGDGGGLPDGAVADGAIADAAIADGGIPTEDAGPAPDAGEIVCGGFGGGTCASDQYCDYDMGCGFADGTGICRPRPTACPPEIRPTCGCNGMTYSSPCDAYAAGTDVLHDGACAT